MLKNIQIVNWLLTRRCNLECSYCGIVRDNTPIYKPLSHYKFHERPPEYINKVLKKFKECNPNMFHIFYGGEPFLYNGLSEVIDFCNDNDIYYTIITNNTPAIQPKINKLIEKVGRLQGLTASIDPIIYDPVIKEYQKDRRQKSLAGLENLISISGKVDDMVAEVTIDRSNLDYVHLLIKNLTKHNICSSITFADIKKSEYYDFSNVINKKYMVDPDNHLREIIEKMISSNLNIHMGEKLLWETFNMLPSKFDCKLEDGLHNLTIDTDGSIRLCLRIGGLYTSVYKVHELFSDVDEIFDSMKHDKKDFCKLCNWTCPKMSLLSLNEHMVKDVIHNRDVL